MRNRVLLVAVAAALVAVSLSALVPAPAAAQDVPPPRLFWTLRAGVSNGELRFLPVDAAGETLPIIVPTVPTIVNLTVITEVGVFHTFSIRSTDAAAPTPLLINLDLPAEPPERSLTVEFTVWAPDRIAFDGRNETVEVRGGGIYFFCQPHEAAGMIGHIVIGGVQEPEESPEKGVFLRAYWIGLLGMAGTLLLVGISYFVIKGSSRHYRDHHDHIRRGGP